MGRSGLSMEVAVTDRLIPLERWLDQWIIHRDVSVRRLIRQTADEEVAHTEDLVGSAIQSLSFWKLSGARDQEMHQVVLVAIGEYVGKRLRVLLAEAD
jgi:hypothetical protein